MTLTSRGQHSALPHLKIPDCLFDTKIPPERDGTQISRNLNSTNTKNHILFPNENENYHSSKGNEKQNYNSKNKRSEKELSAESYVRYLRMYARRFGLDSTMRLGCSVVKVSRLPATSVCGESAGGVSTVGYPPRDDMWEVQYSFTDINGERKLAVLYSKCVVVACGKAQIPISDHNLTEALKGFSGQTVYAKDVKDIEGTWI